MAARNRSLATMYLGLRWRLMLAMGVLALIIVVIGLAAPFAVGRLRAEVHQAVQVDGQMSRLAAEVNLKAQTTRRYDQSYLLNIESRGERYAYRLRWDAAVAELAVAIAAFKAAATQVEDLRQAQVWAAAFELYTDGFRTVAAEIDAGRLGSSSAANQRLDVYRENIETLTDLSSDFVARKQATTEHSILLLDTRGRWLNLSIGVLGLLGILIAIAWSLYFPSRLTRPLGALSATAGALAGGDLTARTGLVGGDEIGTLGRAFDQMAATIEQRTADLQRQYEAASVARHEAEAARAQVAEQLATIAAQRSAIQEMGIPILPVARSVLVLPLVGALDGARIIQAQERAFHAIETSRAAYLIIDITGVPVVDTYVAKGLVAIIHGADLLGAQALLVGIRPEVAETIVSLGVNLGEIVTRATLEAGVSYTTHAANGTRHNGART